MRKLYDKLTGILEEKQDLIDKLESKPLNDRRAARLERLRNRVENLTERTQLLEPLLDKFIISYSDNAIEVDIYDSPFDDTFERGDPLWVQTTTSVRKPNGGTSTRTMTSTLANGNYWEGGLEQTVFAGGSGIQDLGSYDQFTVGILDGDNKNGQLLAVETFS